MREERVIEELIRFICKSLLWSTLRVYLWTIAPKPCPGGATQHPSIHPATSSLFGSPTFQWDLIERFPWLTEWRTDWLTELDEWISHSFTQILQLVWLWHKCCSHSLSKMEGLLKLPKRQTLPTVWSTQLPYPSEVNRKRTLITTVWHWWWIVSKMLILTIKDSFTWSALGQLQ